MHILCKSHKSLLYKHLYLCRSCKFLLHKWLQNRPIGMLYCLYLPIVHACQNGRSCLCICRLICYFVYSYMDKLADMWLSDDGLPTWQNTILHRPNKSTTVCHYGRLLPPPVPPLLSDFTTQPSYVLGRHSFQKI